MAPGGARQRHGAGRDVAKPGGELTMIPPPLERRTSAASDVFPLLHKTGAMHLVVVARQRYRMARGRPERTTHADFARATADRENHDTVETNGSERQRYRSEDAETLGDDAFADGRVADYGGVVAHPVERCIGVDLVHDRVESWRKRKRITARPDGDRGDTEHVLAQRAQHRRRWVSAGRVERQWCDHADDRDARTIRIARIHAETPAQNRGVTAEAFDEFSIDDGNLFGVGTIAIVEEASRFEFDAEGTEKMRIDRAGKESRQRAASRRDAARQNLVETVVERARQRRADARVDDLGVFAQAL